MTSISLAMRPFPLLPAEPGYPLELKRTLLCKWAAHVERIVQPRGAALLR